MVKKLNFIVILFFFVSFLQCYPTFFNKGDPDSALGLLYGYDFSEILGGVPEIEIPNQQTSIVEGESVDFKVKLSKKSLQNRQITISSDNSAVTINGTSSTTITFTPTNSTEDQVFTVKAENDDNLVSEEAGIHITSDWYSEIVLKVINKEKDTQSVLLTGDTVLDRGSSPTLQVRLAKKPENNVDIKISTASGLVSLSTTTLTFTPDNYSVNQSLDFHVWNKLEYLSRSVDLQFGASGIPTLVQALTIKPNLEYKDISAGQGGGDGNLPSIACTNTNLFMVTQSSSGKPGITRCNLDGTSCSYIEINYYGKNPSIAIDAKIYITFMDTSNSNKPGLYICNLDLSGCFYKGISTGQGSDSGWYPKIVIDKQRLLIVTHNLSNSKKPGLFTCDLNGENCSYIDISSLLSGGPWENTFYTPSISVDSSSNILIATKNDSNDSKLSLFLCNSDITNCSQTNISSVVGQGNNSGNSPSILVYDSKVYIATNNGNNSYRPALFYCDLDGSNCHYADISAGQGSYSGRDPKLLIDQKNSKILVVTKNEPNSNRPSVFQCDLNGLNCIHSEIYIGSGNGSEISHDAIIDAINYRILVVSTVGVNSFKPALFRFFLNLESNL
ncbi:MAG: hypothetical protein H7A23_06555 [Leptospiraceae bacterium]|nr:hypothetical protein [Leptospiraceae bacterium]MCP5494200.1 hypothetical protein [Leptospiraceae bacterium]